MRILIDECVDERLRNSFSEHDCQTVRYAGFAGLQPRQQRQLGNRLRNIGVSFASFNYIGISNPSAAAPNYSGVINTGLDLSVVPGFRAPQFEDFSLMPNSMLVNAGITSRPTPFQDFAGKFARRAAGHRGVRVRGDAGP